MSPENPTLTPNINRIMLTTPVFIGPPLSYRLEFDNQDEYRLTGIFAFSSPGMEPETYESQAGANSIWFGPEGVDRHFTFVFAKDDWGPISPNEIVRINPRLFPNF
jgi:hypothetical protein